MKLLKSIALAAALALLAPAAAFAQYVASPLQNGVPTGPSVTGSDLTAGIYFGTKRVGVGGHFESGNTGTPTTPVVSSCGTGTLTAGSTDTAGEFTATGATGCTLTFGTAFAAAPSCIVTEETVNTAARTTTVTTTTLVVASGTSGSKYSYMCVAKSGG